MKKEENTGVEENTYHYLTVVFSFLLFIWRLTNFLIYFMFNINLDGLKKWTWCKLYSKTRKDYSLILLTGHSCFPAPWLSRYPLSRSLGIVTSGYRSSSLPWVLMKQCVWKFNTSDIIMNMWFDLKLTIRLSMLRSRILTEFSQIYVSSRFSGVFTVPDPVVPLNVWCLYLIKGVIVLPFKRSFSTLE